MQKVITKTNLNIPTTTVNKLPVTILDKLYLAIIIIALNQKTNNTKGILKESRPTHTLKNFHLNPHAHKPTIQKKLNNKYPYTINTQKKYLIIKF